MGISGAQSYRRRPQGLVAATEVSAHQIDDRASPTEHRTPRQKRDRRHRRCSAERHLRVRSRLASTLGVGRLCPRREPRML